MFLDLVRKAKKCLQRLKRLRKKNAKPRGGGEKINKQKKTQDSRKNTQTPANPEISLF